MSFIMFNPCLNCGNVTFSLKYHIRNNKRHISSCTKCGLVQVNPRDNILNFSDYEDAASREYKLKAIISLMEGGKGLNLREIMEREVEIKREHFKIKIRDIEKYKKSGKLVDIGCAGGAFLSACSSSDFQLYGVEPSKYTYAEAVKLVSNGTILNSTLVEARLSSDDFDVVTVINTLEHMLNPKETLIEIYRILKPGGLLMIETPNVNHWIPKILGRKWLQFVPPDHVVFFSKDTLISLLEEIGFKVREIKSAFKTISVSLLLFNLKHYFGSLDRIALKITEKTGLAGKILSIPQWDEMILFVVK